MWDLAGSAEWSMEGRPGGCLQQNGAALAASALFSQAAGLGVMHIPLSQGHFLANKLS